MKVAFVCVQNAGRSQIATAFAERERGERGLTTLELVTGGTDPADRVHPEVVETMAEVGIDLAGREPRAVSTAELASCDVVVTMGCSTLDIDGDDGVGDEDEGASGGVDVRDWALPDPDGESPERVREIREQVRERVRELFDELTADELTAQHGERTTDQSR